MKNLEKFLSILDGEVDGLLLTSRYSRHYGAEFDIAEGMAVVSKKGCVPVRIMYPGSQDWEQRQQTAIKILRKKLQQ